MNRSLLLHVCCVHCAAYTVEYWRQQGFEVTAYWYNPNIHPHDEYRSRLEAMRVYVEEKNIPFLVAGYEPLAYFINVVNSSDVRCRTCFDMRLSKTAVAAKEGGYDGFTSTLLISPHQDHELIKETANIVTKQSGVEFIYADLRKRYSDSRHITKPLYLYRQQYCGCMYSFMERLQAPVRKSAART